MFSSDKRSVQMQGISLVNQSDCLSRGPPCAEATVVQLCRAMVKVAPAMVMQCKAFEATDSQTTVSAGGRNMVTSVTMKHGSSY